MHGAALNPALVVEANLRVSMRAYSHASPDGEYREYPGIAVSSAGVNYSVFNSALFTVPVADDGQLEGRLTQAAVHFGARGEGWTCWMCEELFEPAVLRSCDAVFARQGMHLLSQAPGMYADSLTRPGRLAEIECRPVSDAATRFDFCDVACVVFALPFRIARAIYAESAYWSSGTRGYVGYVGRKPVSVVAAVLAGEAIGIYSLGTLPQHQRRGYGEAMLRRAVDDIRNSSGLERVVLQSTSSGFALYRRLGLRTVTRFRVYDHSAVSGRLA